MLDIKFELNRSVHFAQTHTRLENTFLASGDDVQRRFEFYIVDFEIMYSYLSYTIIIIGIRLKQVKLILHQKRNSYGGLMVHD